MNLLKPIDKFLNDITMYKLLVYGLSVLLTAALVFSAIHKLFISGSAMIFSFVVILCVGYIVGRCLSVVFDAAANTESSLITCLILCLIMPPQTTAHGLSLLALVTIIALSSKYIVARKLKHLFNPAAFGALVLGLASLLPATWWVGSPVMLIPVTILGLLILRKIKRFQLFFSFVIAALIMAIILGLKNDQAISYVLSTAIKSSPLIFLGTIMLTEPATSPPRLWQQRIYGLLVGVIFTSQLRFGIVSATPEIALIIGNIYAYIVSPKFKLRLSLKSKTRLAPDIYDFGFSGATELDFQPGQYLEWTMAGSDKPDSRGNRRVFSIASAPGDEELHIAIKLPPSSSSFKKRLTSMQPGQIIQAGQLSGDFIMPEDTDKKLVFIAGGIGITPFVSMAKTMIKKRQERDIVLMYLVNRPNEFCYSEIWREASKFGLRIIPIVTSDPAPKEWTGLVGRLTKESVVREVPDYLHRQYYLSGPNALVDNYSRLLASLNIGRDRIITDYFSGY